MLDLSHIRETDQHKYFKAIQEWTSQPTKDTAQLLEKFSKELYINPKNRMETQKVYRGIKIEAKLLPKFLDNKSFTFRTRKVPLVSWSGKEKIAYEFTQQGARTFNNVGILVEVQAKVYHM